MKETLTNVSNSEDFLTDKQWKSFSWAAGEKVFL